MLTVDGDENNLKFKFNEVFILSHSWRSEISTSETVSDEIKTQKKKWMGVSVYST